MMLISIDRVAYAETLASKVPQYDLVWPWSVKRQEALPAHEWKSGKVDANVASL
jgi:hypothetical protein